MSLAYSVVTRIGNLTTKDAKGHEGWKPGATPSSGNSSLSRTSVRQSLTEPPTIPNKPHPPPSDFFDAAAPLIAAAPGLPPDLAAPFSMRDRTFPTSHSRFSDLLIALPRPRVASPPIRRRPLAVRSRTVFRRRISGPTTDPAPPLVDPARPLADPARPSGRCLHAPWPNSCARTFGRSRGISFGRMSPGPFGDAGPRLVGFNTQAGCLRPTRLSATKRHFSIC